MRGGDHYYEVCIANAHKNQFVAGPFVLVDTAIENMRKRSKSSAFDLIVVLVDQDRHGLKTRTARAFSSGGRWEWGKRCDACLGTGNQVTYAFGGGVQCGTCQGIGSVPEHGLTLRPPPYHHP